MRSSHMISSFYNSLDVIGTTRQWHLQFNSSKVFYSASHKGLELKLHCYNISDKVFAWFSRHLHNKKQQVILKTSFSNFGHLIAGVRQGSVIAPSLIYIHVILGSSILVIRLFEPP